MNLLNLGRTLRTREVPAAIVINYDSAWRSPFAEWALRQRWDLERLGGQKVHKMDKLTPPSIGPA
jgi:hypothetical protein